MRTCETIFGGNDSDILNDHLTLLHSEQPGLLAVLSAKRLTQGNISVCIGAGWGRELTTVRSATHFVPLIRTAS